MPKGGGRPPPPPKPEELIEMLEKKFEAYKEEMSAALDEKSAQIQELTEKLDTVKENSDGKFDGIEKSIEEAQMKTDSNVENLKQDHEEKILNEKNEIRSVLDSKILDLQQSLGNLPFDKDLDF